MTTATNKSNEIQDYYSFFLETQKTRVSDGKNDSIIDNQQSVNYVLVIVLPQLGDFDSLEYAWWLNKQRSQLQAKNITVKAIAIGSVASGKKFCQYTNFTETDLFIDENGSIHRELGLYEGLQWSLPGLNAPQKAWFNLLLMCAGIGSKGTLKEVFRGYRGDKTAPQLYKESETIEIKPFPTVKGSLFATVGKDYQRPFELATLRLENMVEVIKNWREYVPDDRYITQRGGTFLFNSDQEVIYQHFDRGILGFAENMSNPLSFLPLD